MDAALALLLSKSLYWSYWGVWEDIFLVSEKSTPAYYVQISRKEFGRAIDELFCPGELLQKKETMIDVPS
jgi:hypothetical protein